ncbi:alpha-amylase family glycosyl hydrolase [Aureliella helgolandensis]|uniref:1,4-alpha-glucan branching enzyme n=1 Tax=Aureliella helgolandensis TaxID=2527968 RepID=A0A518G3G9_9BACT|nr:alpha-amylase family glycosyl hydrolase [Aureliella helgolandensis]QDV23147.1 1,4-alpha-glucan branching enzyme GlgB [Aureliella helgolandensis]
MTVSNVDTVAGMGAIPHERGVAFRVWAPHADSVRVIGTFNDWSHTSPVMEAESHGYWYINCAEAKIGDEYKFLLQNGEQVLEKIDPYARQVTNSVGSSVVHQPDFDWGEDDFTLPAWNELVIYEMHVGTFGRKTEEVGDQNADFDSIEKHFGHLTKLGVNAIQLMPLAEFAGDISWGYNPAHIFAVESAYGGPIELKEFVKQAHARGFAVILDVVYNHFGPSDTDLWQFDGWSDNGLGGIYFYNDWRAATPWGDTRPDYGRGEVRQFIFDNAMMWLEDYRMDGLRFDMTLYIRSVDSNGDTEIPEGWGLTQWINREIQAKYPGRLTIAEDLQNNDYLTRPTDVGGAGFGAQWDAGFVHPIRNALIVPHDDQRSMWSVRDALYHRYNQDAFERIVYTESHDEVANGKARVPEEISPDDPGDWFAKKRSTLGAALVLTAPGIPMLFQGQEFLQGDWFDDQVPLDWEQATEYSGIVRLYRDLIALRLNRESTTGGLCGQHINVHHVNDGDKVLSYHRWKEGGATDDVVVVINFANRTWDAYEIGLPHPGTWTLRLSTDSNHYSAGFSNHPSADLEAVAHPSDGYPASGKLSIGPYTALVYSQNALPE